MDSQKIAQNVQSLRRDNGQQNEEQSFIDSKISDIDVSQFQRRDSGSFYSQSQYQHQMSTDRLNGIQQSDRYLKSDSINENSKMVKFVSGLKDDAVEQKLSSLYCVDKDMIQMPIIDLPSSNQYGFEEDVYFQKNKNGIDQLKLWRNLTKDILTPFVPTMRQLVSSSTNLEKVIQNDKMKFTPVNEKSQLKKKFKKIKDVPTLQAVKQPKTHRISNSLDHFFQYFIKDDIKDNNSYISGQNLNANQLSKFQNSVSDSKQKNKRGSVLFVPNIQKKILKNSLQVPSKNGSGSVTPFMTLPEDENSGSQKQIKSINSPRNSVLSTNSPQNWKRMTTSSFGQTLNIPTLLANNTTIAAQNATQGRNENSDVFQILDRKYRKKYNLEYKMQMRRKSCYCSHCGICTRFENKYQNIVNPLLVRKKKQFTKVFKVVNFLSLMGRTTKNIPSQAEIENNESNPSVPKIPSLDDQINSKGEIKLNPFNIKKVVKNDPPSLTLIEKNDLEENPFKRLRNRLATQKIDAQKLEAQKSEAQKQEMLQEEALKLEKQKQEAIKQENENKQPEQVQKNIILKKSNTMHFQNNKKQKIKTDILHDTDSSDYTPNHNDDEDSQEDPYERQQQSFEIEMTTDLNLSISRGHKVADIRSKQKKGSYIQEKQNFLSFIDKKIKEAKKKRLEEEIKYVGKTPLTVLLQILSQGKRQSVFNVTEEKEKKIQKFIENKNPHHTVQYYQNRQQNSIFNNEQTNYGSNSEYLQVEKRSQTNKNQNNCHSNNQQAQINQNYEDHAISVDQQYNSETQRQTQTSTQQPIISLDIFKKKINKKLQIQKQREQEFQIQSQSTSLKSDNNRITIFSSGQKRRLLDSALNSLKIITKQALHEQNDINIYLKQDNILKQSSKKIISLREKKLISPCLSSQRNAHTASYSTLRQTNTAQTTDRSSVFSNSNKKQSDTKSNNIRKNKIYLNNEFYTSRSNLNTTDNHQSREKFGKTLNIDTNSFNQSYLHNKTSSKLISPHIQILQNEPPLTSKSNLYKKQVIQINKIAKFPDYQGSSSTKSQSSYTKFFKISKSSKTVVT